MTNAAALFLGTFEDKPYLPHLKSFFGGVPTYVVTDQIETILQLELYCDARNVTRVATTSLTILKKLVNKLATNVDVEPKINDYAGSFFKHTCLSKRVLEIVIIDPLAQLVTVPYGRFITARYISKLISPQKWYSPTPFSFTVLNNPGEIESAYNALSEAHAIAVDIETVKENLAIRCISFTGIYISVLGAVTTRTWVLPLDSVFNLVWLRKFNDLKPYKIFQKGMYDNAYFLRFNSEPYNWLGDTAHLMHSWFAELPKDLGFQNGFFLREVIYHKDLAATNDKYEYYKYNAMDSWATANVWIVQILTAPEWALHNYFLEFPLVFPCLLSNMTGVLRDTTMLEKARGEIDAEVATLQASLNKILGVSFNARSPDQVKVLLKVLTGKQWDSSDEKTLEKVAFMHPLNRVIIDKILKIRELLKSKTTYLRTDADIKRKKDGEPYAGSKGSKDYKNVWLYSLDPGGTDSGRLACGESAFWCGANIQNVTRGRIVKQTITFGSEFLGAEADLEQAESRDTAYIIGSESLITAVTGIRDFHSVNASAFFGTPYDEIYSDALRKTINKVLRDLAKRVNHGANYNMGPDVLVDTMGEENIWKAKKLLKLPGYWSSRDVAEYLLGQFHKTYPELQRDYYPSVVHSVVTTRLLVSRAVHATNERFGTIQTGDWTRYCFGSPDKNKLHLNSYVAHCPQSLNARTLNEAYMRVFYEIALPHSRDFRLHAQIHDSILFSFRKGMEHLADGVRKCMEIPVTVRDVHGVERTFTVPASIKAGKDGKGVTHWCDTE